MSLGPGGQPVKWSCCLPLSRCHLAAGGVSCLPCCRTSGEVSQKWMAWTEGSECWQAEGQGGDGDRQPHLQTDGQGKRKGVSNSATGARALLALGFLFPSFFLIHVIAHAHVVHTVLYPAFLLITCQPFPVIYSFRTHHFGHLMFH